MRAWLRQPENEDEFMAVGKAGGRCGGFALSPRAVLCVWLARVCVGVGGGGHGERAGDAAIGFGFLTAVTRYLVLTRVFWELLRAPDGERVPFWGYVLATEALAIPTLFTLPYPEMRPWVGLWNTWCFWAQFAGAVAISGQRPLRVAGAYVVYWLVSSLLLFVFLLMFVSSSWLDANELNANVVKMLEAMQQAR